MGRSVSYPHNATVVTYKHIEVSDDYDAEQGQEAFDSMLEDLQEYAPTLWPSLRTCDKWLDREDHAVLENDLAYIGISEYCGIVALWIVPKTDEYENSGYAESASKAQLCDHWVDQIKNKFVETFGTLHKVATFSNGEAVYRRDAA